MSELADPDQLHRDLEELICDGYARMYIDREPALKLIEARDNAVREQFAADVMFLYRADPNISWERIEKDLAGIIEKYTPPKEPR